MKLSKTQRQLLKTAVKTRATSKHGLCYVSPGNSSLRRSVDGLVKRGLVEWVEPEGRASSEKTRLLWAETQYRITAAGRKAYNDTIEVPFDIVPRDFPRMSDEDLNAFVLSFCNNALLCDFQVDPGLVGTVFMPLIFGALTVPDELKPPCPDEPIEPVCPTQPEPIEKPSKRPAPKVPNKLVRLREELQEIRNKIEWGDADEADLERFMARHGAKMEKLQAKFEAKITEYGDGQKAYEKDLASWEAQKAAQATVYQEALDHYEAEKRAYAASRAAYDAEMEVCHEREGRITELYFANLGIVYEYYSEAVGSRSINGFPFFGSCRLMHKADWERAREAINRELKRREEIEI